MCRHRRRREVDAAIIAGEPIRALSRRLKVGRSALMRHVPHVAQALARAQAKDERVTGETILSRVNRVYEKLEICLACAERSGHLAATVATLREMRETIRAHADLLERANVPGKQGPVQITVQYANELAYRGAMAALEAGEPREKVRRDVGGELFDQLLSTYVAQATRPTRSPRKRSS